MSSIPSDHTTLILYDAALGGTPDTQGKLTYRDTRAAAAVQSFADGCTTLDTMTNQQDGAGYFADPHALPALDRQNGYTRRFTVQVVEEYHADSDKDGDGVGDRAGFSVIALSSDTKGIEMNSIAKMILHRPGPIVYRRDPAFRAPSARPPIRTRVPSPQAAPR
jgi:hypothetical protein